MPQGKVYLRSAAGGVEIDLCSIHASTETLAYLNGNSKRLVDICGALVGIALLMPIFLIAAVVVFVIDRVPILYSQKRLGINGRPFKIIKLRTLAVDEKRISKPNTIYTKPSYSTTKTGKFWRVTSIDEIIQFCLVLKGEMSLIGHRPIPFYYISQLEKMSNMDPSRTAHYLSVMSRYKPGMSSLSSVNGRGDLTLYQKFIYDLLYAEEANFFYDAKILLQTIYVVLTRQGAK